MSRPKGSDAQSRNWNDVPQRPYRHFQPKGTVREMRPLRTLTGTQTKKLQNPPGERQDIHWENNTMSNASVSTITIVTVISNKCDVCGVALANPNHRFCKDHFKKASKPAAASKVAKAPVTAPATPVATPTVETAPVVAAAPAVEAPKAETEPTAPAATVSRPAPERPAHITVKTCKCGGKFVPRDPRHDKCPKCHKAVMIARRAEEAERKAECRAEEKRREAQQALLTAYRNGTLPKGAKVTENGAQIVIVINGVSTTLYDHEGFNARREAVRQAEIAKAKAAADKARADAEKAAAEKARQDRIGKALFRTFSSGKALPATVIAKRVGITVTFTVSVVGQSPATYTAVDPELAAAEDAARRANEAMVKAMRKAEQKKSGKKSAA